MNLAIALAHALYLRGGRADRCSPKPALMSLAPTDIAIRTKQFVMCMNTVRQTRQRPSLLDVRTTGVFEDIGDTHIKNSGLWGQPFRYSEIAHVVIPRRFDFESGDFKDDTYAYGIKVQEIDGRSKVLSQSASRIV